MNLVLILITSLFLHVGSGQDFGCLEPTTLIHPCTCTKSPFHMVNCTNVGLDIIRDVLAGRFPKPLPALIITNVSSLPKRALGDIRVKYLSVTDSDIRNIGIHDDAFDFQDSLERLRLRNDHLRDIPTEALTRLPGLRTLELQDNDITKIGVNSFDVESHFRILDLENNSLSTIERGAFPWSLRALDLDHNNLSTLNGSLLHLTSLEWISVAYNKLTSVLVEFRGLNRLTRLNLEGNGLASLDGALDDLTSLTELNLGNNHLLILEDLHHLTNLQSLDISDNRIQHLGANIFRSLDGITSLDLSGNRIRNVCEAIRPLNDLYRLNLSKMGLKHMRSDCLKGMKSLEFLDLSQNLVTNIDEVVGNIFSENITLSV